MPAAADDKDKDATKTGPAPDSTWGATEAAKAAWAKKYGKPKKDEK